MRDLDVLMTWAPAVLVAIDLFWLAGVWWIAGPRLRAAAVVATACTVAWALSVTDVVPFAALRSPALDLTGVLWHGVLAPLSLMILLVGGIVRGVRHALSRSTSQSGASSGMS